MTTRELVNDVSALCFYDIGESDGRFIAYANLALKTIYKELNILGIGKVNFEDGASYKDQRRENEGESAKKETDQAGLPRVFDMRELFCDFQSFCLPPEDANGNRIADAAFSDSILMLRAHSADPFVIIYRRRPRRIFADLPDASIDIPEEYTDLLTFLCAYFICLEDDRDSASHYRELYQSSLSSHKENSRERLGESSIITNGWA